jgi:hypothetical protein
MGIPIFKHNDIEINYVMKGKGKPLVLVHGFGTKYQLSLYNGYVRGRY